jgi:hypothetical protein
VAVLKGSFASKNGSITYIIVSRGVSLYSTLYIISEIASAAPSANKVLSRGLVSDLECRRGLL